MFHTSYYPFEINDDDRQYVSYYVKTVACFNCMIL